MMHRMTGLEYPSVAVVDATKARNLSARKPPRAADEWDSFVFQAWRLLILRFLKTRDLRADHHRRSGFSMNWAVFRRNRRSRGLVAGGGCEHGHEHGELGPGRPR